MCREIGNPEGCAFGDKCHFCHDKSHLDGTAPQPVLPIGGIRGGFRGGRGGGGYRGGAGNAGFRGAFRGNIDAMNLIFHLSKKIPKCLFI